MRRPNRQAHVFSLSKTNIQSIFMAGIAFVVMTFLIVSMLTTADNHSRFASSALHDWTAEMQSDWFVHLLGAENRYYLDALPNASTPSLTTAALELATNMNLEDPRTFLGQELPGFSGFDDTLVVAGQGTDFTNMSIESAPPSEDVLQEQASSDETSGGEGQEEEGSANIDSGNPLIHISHAHNREAFHSEIEGDEDLHPEENIVKVGEYFADAFREHDLPVEVSDDDVTGMLDEEGLDYSQSYEMNREIVEEAKEEHEELEFFFDLHRDSVGREHTAVTINEEVYARTFFVIGEDHPDYEQNLEMATEIHNRLEERWPGLSRGVITRGGAGVNGVYNQDLSPNSMLIEFGGVDNTYEEVYRSADALAEVLQEYIHEELEEN
ncbi:stage II sporulation protein P [Salicibibacter halophilus]|uniref:Stage II sporulation protein P n=1 Tax=Salicibibacter halophilus TaxID=2502791 RepID=A0A514LD28_9BACI|nr:stage II sporulation protein P [Salicibibacter halophilus]QDI89759.1 stage II sporulation protein P [Salicibibacter halophilus]